MNIKLHLWFGYHLCDISDQCISPCSKLGKVDVHVTIDIPETTELVEPLDESCVWRQVRGAAVEVLGINSTAATVEKVSVNHDFSLIN